MQTSNQNACHIHMCFLWLSANLYPNSVPTCVWGSSSQLEHPNLHQWNASPKFSIQVLLVPMGSESMQCLVEVETQSFEIKHLLPWSHHVVSHHVTLKWIRVLCVPLTSKSFQFRVASLSSCKLTPKIRARFCHFCQRILPFFHKRLNTENDSRRSRRSRRGSNLDFFANQALWASSLVRCWQPDDFSDQFDHYSWLKLSVTHLLYCVVHCILCDIHDHTYIIIYPCAWLD